MENSNVTNFPKEKISKESSTIENSLSPREIVSELDRFVVGQNKAKRAVAIALRNRWRRQALSGDMKDEVLPKNILMIGPAGITLHVENIYGDNSHHIIESCFKGLARSLRTALEMDPRNKTTIPSTKGSL